MSTDLAFTQGDLVVSVYGDGDDSGTYTDNQASPIVLEEVTTAGLTVGALSLPQTTAEIAGTPNTVISGEYGSSSEGTLELSADQHSLVIAGYGVNAATFNQGGAGVYGTAALAQTTSLPGGSVTAVPRVIADIHADGLVDTSTALYDVANTNNPRSVATVDGSAFYLSGQGVKGDSTQGVFYATDGASSATALSTADDTRTVEISKNTLYVSQDSKQPSKGGTSNVASFGGLPTSATTDTPLPGISQTVTLNGANGNGVNASSGTVNLSPENFFFANSTTLYVADGGNPKQGGQGDGGLQKWSLLNGAWALDYTVSAGLDLVSVTSSTSGTTGLIGLTGQVVGNEVELYATNSALGDLDPTFLYGITDTLAATTLPSAEAFTTLLTAAADTNIRGVAFAPSPACYCAGTLILTDRGERTVQSLRIGDRVITVSGAAEPIRWIGRRSYPARVVANSRDLRPIRIRAGALGDGLPRRDLRISPMHALYLDDRLVPAWLLVDDVGIVQETPCDGIAYFHVELAAHDIILAEGTPAETFVDDDSRFVFDNAREFASLYGEQDARGLYCAPRIETGPALEAIRRRLHIVTA